MTDSPVTAPDDAGTAPTAMPRTVTSEHRLDDRLFRGGTRAVGLAVFALLFSIGAFLLWKSMPAFRKNGIISFLTTSGFTTNGTAHPVFGVAALLFWTVVIALIAAVIGVPIAVGTALFIVEYAPLRLRRALIIVIDLLAVVPSIIFGLWGFFFLQPHMVGFEKFLTTHLGFIPIFHTTSPILESSAFIAGTVVGIMIVPIVTSITREIFSLAPQGEREAALALGASKASMIRAVVLPFGRGGMIGAIMLGIGRAMGETVAVATIISTVFVIDPHILQVGANSIAAFIVLRFGSGGPLGLSALLGIGFVLFCFTLLVNLAASFIVNRSRTGASA
ncbi:MAG: phosphate ABC transporter permease subunit PstC [Acidimicrobiales bacterium]|jgi:phosphate transport system permease protein